MGQQDMISPTPLGKWQQYPGTLPAQLNGYSPAPPQAEES